MGVGAGDAGADAPATPVARVQMAFQTLAGGASNSHSAGALPAGAVTAARSAAATAEAAQRAVRMSLEGAADRLREQRSVMAAEIDAKRRHAERELQQLQRWHASKPWERRGAGAGGGGAATGGAPSMELGAPRAAPITPMKQQGRPQEVGGRAGPLDALLARASPSAAERLEDAMRRLPGSPGAAKQKARRNGEAAEQPHGAFVAEGGAPALPFPLPLPQQQRPEGPPAAAGGGAAQQQQQQQQQQEPANPLVALREAARQSVEQLKERVDRAMAQQQERLRAEQEGWVDDRQRPSPPRVLARAMALLPFTPHNLSRRRRQAEAAASASEAGEDADAARRLARRRPAPPADLAKSKVAIVTTASLPWMTGTAVNPLLRAAFLAKGGTQVTLVVPWLGRQDQHRVYPGSLVFETPAAQEEWIRDWLARRVGFEADFRINFYPGRYSKEYGSILADGDITSFIPEGAADVAVLEEPEHLNWYHHGERWTDRFSHVVGVMHTNYLEYARHEAGGKWKALSLRYINKWMCRSYCDKVIKLSDAVQELPRSITTNVHGVCPHFLAIGDAQHASADAGEEAFGKGAYFVGKCLWSKGYRELLDLMRDQKERDGRAFAIDAYGGGEDLEAVKALAQDRALDVHMLGPLDHANKRVHGYKVFVNPSESDVLCTCTAEALAMGKFVVLKDNPSNQFFKAFPNAYLYSTPEEFSAHVAHCLSSQPTPLQPEHRHMLTWEAATERFLEAARPGVGDARVSPDGHQPRHVRALDSLLAGAHWAMGLNEGFRLAAGANPRSAAVSVEQALDLGVVQPEGPDAKLRRP